jgi:hypothetical protein
MHFVIRTVLSVNALRDTYGFFVRAPELFCARYLVSGIW